MSESEQIVTRSKVNTILVFVTIGMIGVSSVLVGYFYIQNTTLENDKAYLQDEISNLENEKTTLQSQVSNLQSEISTSYESGYDAGYDDGNESGYILGFYDGNETGYTNGYIQGVEDGAGRGYNIRDPIYQEALQFIASDQTDKNQYNEENYTCFHFTADFKSNAFQAGYRCGFVYIELVAGAHAIVCFNTTDKDIIFIEPQDDNIIALTIGQPYWDRTIYEPPDYNDTVVSFTIIW